MSARIQDRRPPQATRGFTLVEILVVITIIGVLAGLLIPAVTGAIARARTASMRTEVEGLSQAIESYKLKHTDYPPDFMSWSVAQRHFRKAFPNIAQEELNLLLSLCTSDGSSNPAMYEPTKVDRAEALVFALGGFSTNPEKPFTGTGGPFQVFTDAGGNPQVQYNIDRDNALFDFDTGRLGLTSPSAGPLSATNRVVSTDDGDLFPVYRMSPEYAPYVFFDSRTYGMAASDGRRNGYAPPGAAPSVEDGGFVRPYFSAQPRPKVGTAPYGTVDAALQAWQFENPKTYQVVGPGIDGIFGSKASTNSLPLYFQYPTGVGIVPDPTKTNPDALKVASLNGYLESSAFGDVTENYQLDNITNFAPGSLESSVGE